MSESETSLSMPSLLCLSFSYSELVADTLSQAPGKRAISIPEECLPEDAGVSIEANNVKVMPPASAGGDSIELIKLNLHQLHSWGFPSALTNIYPNLRQVSRFNIETVKVDELLKDVELEHIQEVFVDCPGLTSELVIALAKSNQQRIDQIQFVLAEAPVFESELSLAEVKATLEGCDYVFSKSSRKGGAHGGLYKAVYDYRAVQLSDVQTELERVLGELSEAQASWESERASWDGERESLLQRLQEGEALAASERASWESEKASWDGERENLLQRLQEAEQQAAQTNQLLQKITIKSQIDAAELRSRYEQRVLEVEQLSSVIEQLQSRLEVAAGLYERLLETSPETLARLGLDP